MSVQGEFYQVKHQILFVLLARIKERKLHTLRSLEKTYSRTSKSKEKGKRKYFNRCRKSIPKETPPTFWHKVDHKGDTNEKTHGSDDSPSETDGCVRNLVKEHENE